jgi:phage terminase large subunit
MAKAVGGKDSAAWKREFLCEPVADQETLVVPEFNELDHARDHIAIPEHFDIYVSMDSGFHDHTAVLIAVLDFLKNKVYVVDEIWVKAKNSEEISKLIKDKISYHFGNKTPYRYVCDAQAQIIYDLNTLHGLPFIMPLKDDKFAAINAMRIKFQERRVEIHRRCTNLIFQLKVGMWNDSKKDFERSDLVGHLDSIAALVYLLRTVDWNKNPYPRLAEGVNRNDYWINEEPSKEQALVNSLFPFARGGH